MIKKHNATNCNSMINFSKDKYKCKNFKFSKQGLFYYHQGKANCKRYLITTVFEYLFMGELFYTRNWNGKIKLFKTSLIYILNSKPNQVNVLRGFQLIIYVMRKMFKKSRTGRPIHYIHEN